MTTILITGGTGTFGQAFTRQLLTNPKTKRVIIFSRDEWKQNQMRETGYDDPRIRWFLGDVRDRDRLRRAMHGVNTVVHAAALKQIVSCEYNPLETLKTNVTGTANVIEAALDTDVSHVLLISSDKAVDPVNLYGTTKLLAERLTVDANHYSGQDGPMFSAVRYGNVISSRGSVIPLFQAQLTQTGRLTVTDPGMTRFVLTIDHACRFVLDCLDVMQGGEVFIPKLDAVTVHTIATAVTWPDPPVMDIVGLRPGEKRHELLVSENEAERTLDQGDHYLITPGRPARDADAYPVGPGSRMPAGWFYSSRDAHRLDTSGLLRLIGDDPAVRVAA